MSSSSTGNTLKFDDGAVQFRLRLIVSILSHRPVLLRHIRAEEAVDAPGLRPYEVSFLRLLDSMTNGSRIEINATGTQVRFVPGILTGGVVEHACPVLEDDQDDHDAAGTCATRVRSIGWFLEGILPLLPFGKEPWTIQFTRGVTDGTDEPSVDYWQVTAPALLARFGVGVSDGDDFLAAAPPSVTIHRRAAVPHGREGRVTVHCPTVRNALKALVDWTETGRFKRVRGRAVSCKLTSGSSTARVAYAGKGVLHRVLPDVWIHTVVHTVKQHACGPSPSLALLLQAESTTGTTLAAEVTLQQQRRRTDNAHSVPPPRETPEELGQRGAATLLHEIYQGGVVDTTAQTPVLLWMCLAPEDDVSRIRIGTLSAYSVAALRLFKTAWGVECKLTPDPDTKTVLVSCVGVGYRNLARAST